MVFESLVNLNSAEKHPGKMLLYGFLYMSVGIFLSLQIFKEQASLVMVFLTTLACLPLVYNTLKDEESKDEAPVTESALLKEHWPAVKMFIVLFFGFVLAGTFWYTMLPAETAQQAFAVQTNTINTINPNAVGRASGIGPFITILTNNLWVTFYCILFAFVFGAGAIFILTWNASVISVAIGSFIRKELAVVANAVGLNSVGNYFSIVSVGLLKYIIHGVPEILAYFTAGLAASIISIAVMKHGHDKEHFKKVLLDSTDLLLISFTLVIIAAFLEVWVTPLIF